MLRSLNQNQFVIESGRTPTRSQSQWYRERVIGCPATALVNSCLRLVAHAHKRDEAAGDDLGERHHLRYIIPPNRDVALLNGHTAWLLSWRSISPRTTRAHQAPVAPRVQGPASDFRPRTRINTSSPSAWSPPAPAGRQDSTIGAGATMCGMAWSWPRTRRPSPPARRSVTAADDVGAARCGATGPQEPSP